MSQELITQQPALATPQADFIPPASIKFSNKDLSIIRGKVPEALNPQEFNEFIYLCEHKGLDPLKNEVYCWLFNAGNAKKRKMTVITGIWGLTGMADRTGTYRPGDERVQFTYDNGEKDSPHNPLGIASAIHICYKFVKGSWHKVESEVFWDEYAPVLTIKWERGGDGRDYPKEVPPYLDPEKKMWHKFGMPRRMLGKCADALNLNMGWATHTAGIRCEEEMDRAMTIDRHQMGMTADELVQHYKTEKRIAAIGGLNMPVDWLVPGQLPEYVPIDQMEGHIHDFLDANTHHPEVVKEWMTRNRETFRQYRAHKGDEAHVIKAKIEGILDGQPKRKQAAK